AVTTEAGAEVCAADVTAARVAAAGAGATDADWTSTAGHRCPKGGRRSSDRTRVAAPDTADGPRPARPRSSAASVGRWHCADPRESSAPPTRRERVRPT